MVAREQTLQSDVDADHPSHRLCYLRCAIQPLGSSVPALKMQTLASTTQGCNNVCSEVSALAAAVAVAADGIDDGKCALCLSPAQLRDPWSQGSVLTLFVSLFWPSMPCCLKMFIGWNEFQKDPVTGEGLIVLRPPGCCCLCQPPTVCLPGPSPAAPWRPLIIALSSPVAGHGPWV